ncbi:MAG: BON domain-containing protein [Planctomycetia bacterium]|jgi:osmotically-inducible protein OsmY
MIDTTLEHRLNAAIQSNVHLRGRKLYIETNGRQVVLRGLVRSFYQKQMAQEAIRNLEGVQVVENQLEVGEPCYG